MSDVIVVKSMADARETGLKVITGSLEESRKSARIFIRVIYCLIVLAVASFEVFTFVTEYRGEVTAQQQLSQHGKAAASKSSIEIPLTSSPKSTWLKLAIPAGVAGSRSELFRYTPSMLKKMQEGNLCIVTDGNGFQLHTVYEGGVECVDGGCAAGPQVGVYVTNKNEMKETNVVSLALESC